MTEPKEQTHEKEIDPIEQGKVHGLSSCPKTYPMYRSPRQYRATTFAPETEDKQATIMMIMRKRLGFRLVLSLCAALTTVHNILVITHTISPLQLLLNCDLVQLPQRKVEDTARVQALVTEWENQHNLVHVVLTRFMQRQPDLLYLGRARLELFKSFCLPSMRKQTSKQFLWIIRADPKLHPELKAEFLSTLREINNVVVIGSNARIDDGHFRHKNSIADIDENTLWMGSMGLLQSYHMAAQNRTTLESGLDADDGLALDFISEIQNEATMVAEAQKKVGVRSWWKIWCTRKSIDWQYYGDYMNSSFGHVVGRGGEPDTCITPGLTRASTPDYRTWKKSQGKQTTGEFPDLAKEGYRFFVDHKFIQEHGLKRGRTAVGGWSFIPGNEFRAVRARTPTSAGMKDVKQAPMTNSSGGPWKTTTRVFGLDINEIRRSREIMEKNFALIIKDAIAGQCSEGHSCKRTAAGKLNRLQKETAKERKN